MAGFDVNIVTFPIQGGTHTAGLGTIPIVGTAILFKAPSNALGGGITILEAEVTTFAGGLGTFTLLTSSSAGTKAINGTISATWGTSTLTAGSAYPLTIGTGFVDADEYVCLAQTGSIIAPGGILSLKYVMGQ
jgi:hypothetical protein